MFDHVLAFKARSRRDFELSSCSETSAECREFALWFAFAIAEAFDMGEEIDRKVDLVRIPRCAEQSHCLGTCKGQTNGFA